MLNNLELSFWNGAVHYPMSQVAACSVLPEGRTSYKQHGTTCLAHLALIGREQMPCHKAQAAACACAPMRACVVGCDVCAPGQGAMQIDKQAS